MLMFYSENNQKRKKAKYGFFNKENFIMYWGEEEKLQCQSFIRSMCMKIRLHPDENVSNCGLKCQVFKKIV